MIAAFSSRFIDDPTQFNTTYFSLIVAGTFAGLLIWNWFPQKMMPGYGAGSLAGFFIGVAAIISGAKVATILLVLGIPTADAVYTIMRRMVHKKSPFWGDRGHLHHILLDTYHVTKQYIALFYMGTTLVLGLIALYLNTTQKMITIALVFVLVFGIHLYTAHKKKA
jgi:UDP-GlcNAc:undecaprenyl-phosphate/decaprenyl-phosphate GlcNAc-1-phosphate transferase